MADPNGDEGGLLAEIAQRFVVALDGRDVKWLAGRLDGFSYDQVYRYTTGRATQVPVAFWPAVAEQLGLSLDWLLLGKGNRDGTPMPELDEETRAQIDKLAHLFKRYER